MALTKALILASSDIAKSSIPNRNYFNAGGIMPAQAKALLHYLMTGQTITAVQALAVLGIASFHRRVTDLKERGWHINSEWVTVPTRYGSGKTKVKQYTLNQTVKGQTL